MLVVRDSMKANHFGAIEDQDKEVTNQREMNLEILETLLLCVNGKTKILKGCRV